MAETVIIDANAITVPEVIKNPLFLKFSEYLGYETPLIKWVDKICDGKEVPSFIEKIIEIDALCVFKKIQEDYTIEEIRYWWDSFYPVVILDAEFKIENAKAKVPY